MSQHLVLLNITRLAHFHDKADIMVCLANLPMIVLPLVMNRNPKVLAAVVSRVVVYPKQAPKCSFLSRVRFIL